MPDQTARNQFAFRPTGVAALLCVLAGAIVYQFFGNASQGYIHTRSLFYWWSFQWFESAAETQHGPLIALAAVWLFWRNLRGHERSPTEVLDRANGRALAALLGGLALHLAGYAMQQARISIVSLLLFAWGVLVLAGGRRLGRAAIFPLAFMLFAVPVNFVDTLGFYLRLDVTAWTYGIAQGLGVHLLRNGTQLFSPDGHFQYDVAAACSGIRSLVALLALALLVGYLNFRSWWAWLVLAAAGLPYVVAGNVVRVLSVVLLGEWFGQAAGERVHSWSGALVFLAVVGLLLATLPLLRRAGFKPADEPHDRASDSEVGRDRWARRAFGNGAPSGRALPKTQDARVVAVLVVVAAALVGVAAVRLDARPAQAVAGVQLQADGVSPVKLPESVGTEWFGRSVDVSDVERAVLPADTGYSRRNYVSLADLRRQVFVSVVLSGRDRTSVHRPELCLIGQGWSITGRAGHVFAAGGDSVPVTLLTVEHAMAGGQAGNVRSLLAYWFVGGEAVEPTHLGMQARDAYDRLRHLRADRWAYVVVQTVIVEGDEAGALARMQEVLAGVWPEIRSKPDGAK